MEPTIYGWIFIHFRKEEKLIPKTAMQPQEKGAIKRVAITIPSSKLTGNTHGFCGTVGAIKPNQQKYTKAMNVILSLMWCLHPEVTMTTIRQLSRIALAVLAMTGRVSMLELARWMGTGGSHRTVQHFFHTTLWATILWSFVRTHLLTRGDRYLLISDECGDQSGHRDA